MSNKFIIYKGSGGLAHMLRGLAHCIKLANITKRYLIIDCKCNKGFGCNFNEFFKIDGLKYSDNYDIIPSTYNFKGFTLEELKKQKISCDNRSYYIFGYIISDFDERSNDDIVIYGGTGGNKLIGNLRVNDNIMSLLNKEPQINDKYISVHFRNTDIKNSFDKFSTRIKRAIMTTKINTVYWASDDYKSFDKLCKKHPNVKFIRYTIPAEKVIRNIHSETKDKFKQIYDCLKDIYFILKSDYFIPSNNSGMSLYIKLMINDKNIFRINSKTIILN